MVIKQRDKSKKRNTILDAAVSVFVEMGYDRASMDHIAEVAAVSKRTVYNHFASKELLFNAVLERFVSAKVEQKQISYEPDIALKEQLFKFADLKMSMSSAPETLNFMRMAFGVMITHPELAEQVMGNIDPDEDGLQNWLIAAVEDGKLNIDDISIAAEAFWSMFSSSFIWMPMLQGPVSKDYAEKLKGEYVALFLSKYQVS